MERPSETEARTGLRDAVRRRSGATLAGVLAVLVAGCATGGSGGGGTGDIEAMSLTSLGIPLNAVPGPGKCRIWRPRSSVSNQLGPGSCSTLARRVGEGGWLLRHPVPPEGGTDRVHLVVYGSSGPSLVRVFDRQTGKMIRKRPAGEVAAAGAGGEGPDRGGAGRESDAAAGAREPAGGAETLYALGIPRGAVPSGQCRVWDPDLPPAEQAAPGPCPEVRDRVGGDQWLLQHRPADEAGGEEGRLVVAAYEEGRVVSIRVFDAATGTLVETRSPE